MNIKMIVTDLDGTLLREDKTISDYTLSVLKKCRENGIKVVYATGRGGSAERLAPAELFDGYVRVNGALAYIGDTLLYKRLVPADKARDLLIAADGASMKATAEVNGVHYTNFNVTELWKFITRYEIVDFHTLDAEAEKLYAVVEKPEDVEFIKKLLPAGLYLYVSRDDIAMVMHHEAIKSKAIAALAEHWGISNKEIAAFGDDTNDIDMLRFCGTGVAMGNALDEVKAVADYICGSNEDDGMARWIEERMS